MILFTRFRAEFKSKRGAIKVRPALSAFSAPSWRQLRQDSVILRTLIQNTRLHPVANSKDTHLGESGVQHASGDCPIGKAGLEHTDTQPSCLRRGRMVVISVRAWNTRLCSCRKGGRKKAWGVLGCGCLRIFVVIDLFTRIIAPEQMRGFDVLRRLLPRRIRRHMRLILCQSPK